MARPQAGMWVSTPGITSHQVGDRPLPLTHPPRDPSVDPGTDDANSVEADARASSRAHAGRSLDATDRSRRSTRSVAECQEEGSDGAE